MGVAAVSATSLRAPIHPARSSLNPLIRFARTSPIGAVAGLGLLLLALTALFAGQLAPADPLTTDYGSLKQPPNETSLLGTDLLGRDVLSRVIWGARVSIFVGLASVLMGDSMGLLLGLASGYLGGRFDLISQRILDALMSFPGLILAMLLVISLGSGLHTVIIAIAVTRIPGSTRVIRSVALQVGAYPFVEAARATGAGTWRIMSRHIGPQCIAPWLVLATGGIGGAIVAEAALSFLGLGVPASIPTWGNMLGGIMAEFFHPPWWLVVFPGVGLTLTVVAANLFGDAMRDFLDPRLRGRLL